MIIRLLHHKLIVRSLSRVWLFATSWIAAYQASLSFTISQSSIKLMSIESMMPSNHLILCHPLFLLLSVFVASGSFLGSQLFTSGGQSIGASAWLSSFQWIFRVDFLWDWLVWSPSCPRDSQESSPTPQFKSINSWCSAFFMVQLSYPYMTTMYD